MTTLAICFCVGGGKCTIFHDISLSLSLYNAVPEIISVLQYNYVSQFGQPTRIITLYFEKFTGIAPVCNFCDSPVSTRRSAHACLCRRMSCFQKWRQRKECELQNFRTNSRAALPHPSRQGRLKAGGPSFQTSCCQSVTIRQIF